MLWFIAFVIVAVVIFLGVAAWERTKQGLAKDAAAVADAVSKGVAAGATAVQKAL